jgi:hypothetical protein
VSQEDLDDLMTREGDNIEDIYPLSPMQQGMVFHTLYEPGGGSYFEQMHFRVRVEPKRFRESWQRLIDRHPVLRTGLWRERSLQIVYRGVEIPWREQDWRDLGLKEQEEHLARLLKNVKKGLICPVPL